MSKSGGLQEVVISILRKNNVELKALMVGVLVDISGHFYAEGLIEQITVNRMRMIGVDQINLAADLLGACQTSLEQRPEENFPKFIAVLKKFVTMEKRAQEMEDEFKEASMSWYIVAFPNRLMHKWLYQEVR